MALFKKAGYESVEYAKEVLLEKILPDLEKRMRSVIDDTLESISKKYVAEMVHSAGKESDQIIQRNVDEILLKLNKTVKSYLDEIDHSLFRIVEHNAKTIRDQAALLVNEIITRIEQRIPNLKETITLTIRQMLQESIVSATTELEVSAPRIIQAAGVAIDDIIQRNVQNVLKETSAFLSEGHYPFFQNIGRTTKQIQKIVEQTSSAIEKVKTLETAQNAKNVIDGLNSLVPEVKSLFENYYKERERERNFGWRVMFGNTAIGLLFASFVYVLYHKMGYKMNPVTGIRLFWIGISVPMVLLFIRGLWSGWSKARKARMTKNIMGWFFTPESTISRLFYLTLLVAGNIILNWWL